MPLVIEHNKSVCPHCSDEALLQEPISPIVAAWPIDDGEINLQIQVGEVLHEIQIPATQNKSGK